MRSRWFRQITLLAVVGGLVTALACAPAGAPTPTPPPAAKPAAPAPTAPAQAAPAAPAKSGQLEAIVEGARKEGELTLVMANILGGNEAIKRWTEGFNKAHGLTLNVNFTPGPPMAEIANRVVQEYQANRPAMTDVLAFAALDVIRVLDGDAVQAIDWATWAPNVQKAPGVVAKGGVAVAVTTHTPGISYNTNNVTGDLVPKSLQDLLKPQYKGKIASTPYTTMFAFASSPEVWGEQRTTEYVKAFAGQVAGLIRCSDLGRLASGEFDLFAMDCGASDHFRLKARGAPLAQTSASDLALTQYYYYLIPKNAPHPNAAKLWVNYVLGREAQDILWETDFSDQHLVPGSKSGARMKQLEAGGVKFVETSLEFVIRSDPKKIMKNLGELDAIIQKKR